MVVVSRPITTGQLALRTLHKYDFLATADGNQEGTIHVRYFACFGMSMRIRFRLHLRLPVVFELLPDDRSPKLQIARANGVQTSVSNEPPSRVF